MKKVDVVALIVQKDGRILVERRKSDEETDPGKVVIPGGHVERGERPEQACKRELKEELGLDCDRFVSVARLLHHTSLEDQMTHFHSCEGWRGEPQCFEAEEIFWIGPDQINMLEIDIDRKVAREFFKRSASGKEP